MIKKNMHLLIAITLVGMLMGCGQKSEQSSVEIVERKPLELIIDEQLDFAVAQYKKMEESLPADKVPRTIDEEGKLITSGTKWWTSGFYPGTLWLLYEGTGQEWVKEAATRRTALLIPEQHNMQDHDLGFKLYCSFGNQLRLIGDTSVIPVMVQGANSLVTRFMPGAGCIKSWDTFQEYTSPVIIDNMMNLELLFWTARQTEDSSFYEIAISHADATLANHFRPDHSSYHVLVYDTLTGEVLARKTHQGFADESAWARGQAWGLYGYTMTFRETRDNKYLMQAENIADYLLDHPNLPKDMVPYWDFDAPNIPDELRDASTASIMASSLLELSEYTGGTRRERYRQAAEQIIRSLSSPAYRAQAGANGNFVLMHSVGSIPHDSEIDVPLTYADYYFIEALLRYKELLKKNT